MAFKLVKTMKGIEPKARSYGPALFGFFKMGFADKADEEAELAALLKLSCEQKRGDKVYEVMHRLRETVTQVTEDTARVVEDWFNSETAAEGGGSWLGEGKWRVVRTRVEGTGVCRSCNHKLVSLDVHPKEIKNFATSLEKLAYNQEISHFLNFQEWLHKRGPFDAVVDGTNVSLSFQHYCNVFQLNCVLNKLKRIHAMKLPLIILHQNHVDSTYALDRSSSRLLHKWKKAGKLYVLPPGSNDDWYWLYAAVTCKCLLVTNDKMRDNFFQLFGTSFFPRWQEKHQVRLDFPKGILRLVMPPPYSNVIQESEQGSWHIPTVTGDDLKTPRQWLCATRSRKPQ